MISEIKLDYGIVLAVIFALVLFGIMYNALVAWLERKGYAEGFLSLIVAAGVLMTLIGISILSMDAALLALMGFVATGTPMIVGSIIRYITAREAAKQALRNEAREK